MRYLATVLIILTAIQASAQTTTLDGIVGWSDRRTALEVTIPGKSETLRASLDLPTKTTMYGVQASAWTQPWAVKMSVLWHYPSRGELSLAESNYFGKSSNGKGTFLGTANRSHEYQVWCEPGWWETRSWRPMKPYFGYNRRSWGWIFAGQEKDTGQIDLAGKHETWFVGLVCQPSPYPLRLEADYGWTRAVIEGTRTGKDSNHLDGTLKGHQWHARIVTEQRIMPDVWLEFAADWYDGRASGPVNFTNTGPLAGSADSTSKEWRLSGALRARW